MSDDVIVGKAAIVERCIARAREELKASVDFDSDTTRQDAAVLNIERACDASLDDLLEFTAMALRLPI